MNSARWRAVAALSALAISLTGCGHKPKQAKTPPPPTIAAPEAPAASASAAQPGPTHRVESEPDRAQEEKDVISIPADTKPIRIETGLASWYGPPYHNRRGSNGEIYNMNAMTAAHKTLPLGSIVRVTNTKTGSSALVRITDRGPFVAGRVIDLSLAAAKKVDCWKAGVIPVRVEVLRTPAPLDTGGRWAVQIGAFEQEEPAIELTNRLAHRYHTAKVLHFGSPIGDWWVRVRVLGDDRQRAEEVARDARTPEGGIYLVRLD
jgi:rare lipoprotein A